MGESNKSKEPEQSKNPIVIALSYLRVEKLSRIEVFLFGLAMILGSRSTIWNTALVEGYYSFLINLVFAGSGYIALCLCMGEMASAMPFSGGIFGFVRAVLGPYCGFLVACCEFVYCMTTVVLKSQRFSSNDDETDSSTDLRGVIIIFCLCLAVNLIGTKPVFFFSTIIGFVLFVCFLSFIIGTLTKVGTPEVNFDKYGGPMIEVSWEHVMAATLPLGTQYNGVQFFPLLSEYLADPRKQLPRFMLVSCFTFLFFSVFVSLCAVSQEPGGDVLSTSQLPLNPGFMRIFKITNHAARWIDLPCQVGVIYCLFYCCGKQLLAISKSGLLPAFLDKTVPGSGAPYICYFVVAAVGTALNALVLQRPQYRAEIRATAFISSVYIFINCCIAYMVFKRKFSSMARSFVNPLGDFAAIYSIIIFFLSGIGLVFYCGVTPVFLFGIGAVLLFATIFFWTYLVHNQKFSEEEKKVMFKAYLINANRNMRKNNNRLKNNKVGPNTMAIPSGGDPNMTVNNNSRGNNSNGFKGPSAHLTTAPPTAREREPETVYPNNEGYESPRHSALPVVVRPPQKPAENTRVSSKSDSHSTRHPEPVTDGVSSKLSTKLVAYISGKLHTVMPVINNMDEKELDDYEQFAALSNGGILDESANEALQARFGSVEASIERDLEVAEV